MTFDQTEISLTFSLTRDTLQVLLLRVCTSLVSEIEVTVLLYLYKNMLWCSQRIACKKTAKPYTAISSLANLIVVLL